MRDVFRALCALACASLLVGKVAAQVPSTPPESLYAAVDQWVERGLTRYQIAGAALAIVRDGAIVHRRGFGFANVERGYRVDADTTVFHIASVTKLLTAIAALQQVEAGKLALHDDIRPMLGNLQADGWNQYPVTLHELLTHSAGLDTRWIGSAARQSTGVGSLDAYLTHSMPSIIDQPGTVVRYSNYGYAAIGRLVEVASGMSWAKYVEQHILQPLGMLRSYAEPRAPPASHAIPYRYRQDTLPEPNVYEHVAPAGAVHATASDLARLIVALLDTTTSLPISPHGKLMLMTPQSSLGPGVAGFAYGTFEYPNARVVAASAGGEVPGFSTRMLIVPGLRLGVVFMVNRKDPTLAMTVFDSLLARVAGRSDNVATCGAPTIHVGLPLPAIGGRYRVNVYEHESFLRVGALLGPLLSVRTDTAGSIVVTRPGDARAERWRRTGDSTWMSADGSCLSLVRRNGEPMLATSTTTGPMMLDRVGVVSSPEFVLISMLSAILVLAVVFVMEIRWATRPRRPEQPRSVTVVHSLAVAVPALHVAFLMVYVVGVYQLAIKYDDRFAFGIPAWFSVVLAVPYVTLVLTAWLAYRLMRGGEERNLGRWRRWMVVMASSALLLIFWQWRA